MNNDDLELINCHYCKKTIHFICVCKDCAMKEQNEGRMKKI